MAMKFQGGRNKRGIMAEVLDWRQEGYSVIKIRDKLKARGYKPPRITELMKKTQKAEALSGAASAPRAKKPAPPPQEKENGANLGPCPSKKPKLRKAAPIPSHR